MKDLEALIRNSIPSVEEMDKRFAQRVEKSKENPNVFSNWFPIVQELGIPHPVTHTFEISSKMYKDILNSEIDSNDFQFCVDKIKEFGGTHGYPLFLKNGVFSNKHDFKHSCVIHENEDYDSIVNKICHIQYSAEMFGVELSLEMVIRKYLDVEPVFYAFNETPIVEEYRLFIKNGAVEGWQAYWPQHSIKNPSVENWKDKLTEISTPDPETFKIIIKYAEILAVEIGGYWSVDFLIDKNGQPYLIDMAIGEMSYKDHDNFNKMS